MIRGIILCHFPIQFYSKWNGEIFKRNLLRQVVRGLKSLQQLTMESTESALRSLGGPFPCLTLPFSTNRP